MIRKLVKIFEADEFVSFQPNISDNIHNFVATNKLQTEIKKKKGLLKHLDKRELSDIVK